MRRRDAIATVGTGTIAVSLSGCLDFAGLRPDSTDQEQEESDDDRGNHDHPSEEEIDDVENSDRTEDDTGDGDPPEPEDAKQRDAGQDVLEFGDLRIIDYEERVEEFEYDEEISYTGEVENVGDEAYESVSVEVRVYDEDGEELGSHRDLTPELAANETWRFEIAPHSRPAEVADHDIAVTGEQ
ncbi:FxLYD domain-containing protein [Natronococcus occultus]|uniref:FxLYD domain-containing protein n=1 Tax=Natronococcus occultus TaxID=29288 RepID=UPI0012F8EDC1|nr:FxLYD domain-containing protein [Natronococcus occultus]